MLLFLPPPSLPFLSLSLRRRRAFYEKLEKLLLMRFSALSLGVLVGSMAAAPLAALAAIVDRLPPLPRGKGLVSQDVVDVSMLMSRNFLCKYFMTLCLHGKKLRLPARTKEILESYIKEAEVRETLSCFLSSRSSPKTFLPPSSFFPRRKFSYFSFLFLFANHFNHLKPGPMLNF
jgi:hypothetical protein